MKPPLINLLKELLQQPLPGKSAHKKMSPFRRFNINESPNIFKSRVSSVLILLYKKEEKWHIPLILRPTYNGEHSGQISLPGGKMELIDRDYACTALRETEEEIGIKPEEIELIGELSPIYIPKSNYIVHPFVGYLAKKPTFIPDAIEVDRILETPLSLLSDSSKIGEHAYQRGDLVITAPCWQINEHNLWGATAMILAEFQEIISDHTF